MKDTCIIACGQFQPEFGAVRRNIERMCEIASAANADLIVFPELATSGYEFRGREEVARLALAISSPELEPLKLCAAQSNTHIVFGFPERSKERLYNSAALIEPSGSITIYRKLHLFDREKNRFDPGDAPAPVIETGIGRLGLMICFDWVFPEMARTLTLGGAQIICHPSNLVLDYCQRAMFARSVENRVFTITCNRIGSEERDGRRLTFTGGSQILSPKGELLAQAGTNSEELIQIEIKPNAADDKMITPLNHLLNDRRPEVYKL
jgi:predicted amidohydrolase